MKSILLILPAIALVSCAKTAEPGTNAYDPSAANPYAVPGANPYAAADTSAPYQPVDQVNDPYTPSAPAYTPSAPAYTPAAPAYTPSAPVAGVGSHTVVAGDSLWGLSRKYSTTVEAIQAANGITGTTIRTGQTLIIPR